MNQTKGTNQNQNILNNNAIHNTYCATTHRVDSANLVPKTNKKNKIERFDNIIDTHTIQVRFCSGVKEEREGGEERLVFVCSKAEKKRRKGER